MTSYTHSAAITIQKLWRGHIFKKALPFALRQAANEVIIYGPQWGDCPLDSEWMDCESDCESDCEEHPCWDVCPELEMYDEGDVAEYWHEQQFECQ